MEERRRYGFYRILWSASDGNPEISLRLYVKSLAIHDDGRYICKDAHCLQISNNWICWTVEQLLVLRVIAQSGYATPEEVQECLALNLNLVQEIFPFNAVAWLDRIGKRLF